MVKHDFPGIYAIRHIGSGRVYVGSSVLISKRWAVHQRSLERGVHHSPVLQRSWAKYGAAAFAFEIVERVDDRKELLQREQHWIDTLRPAFNVCKTAGSQLGMSHSAEAREKMSAARKGAKKTASHQAAINAALKGRRLSEGCKSLLADARRGTKASEQTRQKMSQTRTGRRPSEETRAKLSANATARHAKARAAGVTLSGKPLMGYELRSKLAGT
jgi:group I intron endonuclease